MPSARSDEPSAETLCARPTPFPESSSPPLAPPLQLSSVYQVADPDRVDAIYEGREAGFIYARDANPNARQFAAKIAALEGAEAAHACGSGMAAEAAVFLAHTSAGGHVALSEGLYGRTGVLVGKELSRFGVEFSLFDPADPESLAKALRPNTSLAFVETITNPLCRVADLPKLAERTKRAGVTFVVDHTFAPLLCRPLEFGADLVLHSATKLIGGHSDVTLGVVAGRADLVARLAHLGSSFGLNANPFDCWLGLRGAATLALRVERTAATALELARRLESHPKILRVNYPGLTSHPDHEAASALLAGRFGAMMSFELPGRDGAERFVRSLKHIPYAPSLGDVSTTLSHPTTTSHRYQSPEEWARQGITPGLIRLSTGLESVEDLWSDLASALGSV